MRRLLIGISCTSAVEMSAGAVHLLIGCGHLLTCTVLKYSETSTYPDAELHCAF
jgi:hypothetical protein